MSEARKTHLMQSLAHWFHARGPIRRFACIVTFRECNGMTSQQGTLGLTPAENLRLLPSDSASSNIGVISRTYVFQKSE